MQEKEIKDLLSDVEICVDGEIPSTWRTTTLTLLKLRLQQPSRTCAPATNDRGRHAELDV